MSIAANNIFDLSALPPAKSDLDSRSTERGRDSQVEQFETVFSGVISENRSISPDHQSNETTAAKPVVEQDQRQPALSKGDKPVVEQDQRQPALSKSDRPVGEEQAKATSHRVANDSPTKADADHKGQAVDSKSKNPKRVGSQVVNQKTDELVQKLTSKSLTDLIDPKAINKTIPTGDASVRASIKSAPTNSNPLASNLTGPLDALAEAIKLDAPTTKFAIKKITTVGDEVEIIASSTKDESKTVKLTIPKDQFDGLVSSKGNVNDAEATSTGKPVARIPLEGISEQVPKLNQLLDKLNLQEIQVKSEVTQTTKIASINQIGRETTVKLVSADSSAELLVKGQIQPVNSKGRSNSRKRIAPREVDLTSAKTGKAAISQNPTATGNGRVSLVNARTTDGSLILKEVKVRSEVFNPAEQLANNPTTTNGDAAKNFSSVMATETSQSSSLSSVRNETAQVRFGLPEDIAQTLTPKGKAVTIKINPEILGPVRLSVRMQGNQLHARLMVDSAQVKSMIEGSLDQLIDQLEKAGIKVDQVNVDVAGSDVGSELFERSSAWSRPKLTTRILEAEEAELLSSVTAVPSRTSGEYVGTSGVNLFA